MLTSIATVSVSGSLESKIAAIAAAGFWGTEIMESDLIGCAIAPREIGALLRSQGLSCTAYQPFRDFEGMTGVLRARTFDRIERKFDITQELGSTRLLICSNVHPESSGDRERIVADFQELGARAARRGLTVGYEALAWGRHVFDHRDAWDIVRRAAHPAIGLVLDSFHSFARKVPVESLRDIDPQKIAIVQLADAPQLYMDELSWSRHFRTMPGQGDFALVDYVGTLQDIGYQGVFSLEIFNDRFRAANAATVAVDGMRSLTYLQDQILRRRQAQLPAPRVRCSGVEFVEFAANDNEAPRLARMLATLGFRENGRHRRKAVTRWTQGDINIVINSEIEGFAHTHDMAHGASVCAIGLRVDDVPAAMARAQALRIATFSQPVGIGEHAIPSLRGVGGSLLYLIKAGSGAAIWEEEFETSVQGPAAIDPGLQTIDNISQVMPYEEMLSWLLFYGSLLELNKTPLIEIADPLGLVQTQAMESPDRTLRIVLNASAAHQTLSSRFLDKYMGAGVQHLTFRTQDIFRSVTQMRRLGVDLLAIPDNYYADIGARFALDQALVEQMAANNILYERDGSGEYFQYFTRAFDKRFFFEIVERRGYDSYGAANAPVRLAAQSRYKTEQ
ncbi:MAG: TIM barrel protein [Pseudomonadota bacterium]